MKRLLPLLIVGATLLTGPSPAAQIQNNQGRLAALRIVGAQQQLSYRGTRLYYSCFDGKVRYQMESVAVRQDGKGRRDLRLRLEQVLHHTAEFPGHAVARTLFSRRQGSILEHRDFRIHDLDQAFKNYAFLVKTTDTVAGRTCDLCVVTPRHADRRPWMLWVDQQTGLILRADEYSVDYKLLSLMVFEPRGLQVGRTTDFTDIKDWYVPAAKTRTFQTLQGAEKVFGRKSLLPTYLPPGFALDRIQTRDLGTKGHLYLSLTYTDGVDTLLVVNGLATSIQSAQGGGGEDGSDEMPIINRYTSGPLVQLWTELQGSMVMVMGRMRPDQVPLTFESIFVGR